MRAPPAQSMISTSQACESLHRRDEKKLDEPRPTRKEDQRSVPAVEPFRSGNPISGRWDTSNSRRYPHSHYRRWTLDRSSEIGGDRPQESPAARRARPPQVWRQLDGSLKVHHPIRLFAVASATTSATRPLNSVKPPQSDSYACSAPGSNEEMS